MMSLFAFHFSKLYFIFSSLSVQLQLHSLLLSVLKKSDPGKKYQSQQLNEIPTQKTLKVRVGENVTIPCPALSKVISRDGSFKYVHWHYCSSKSCNAQNTKWSWIAGMNRSSKTGAIRKGRIFLVVITRYHVFHLQVH